MYSANGRSYDPDYEQWEFGKLSAMREIAMAIEDGYKNYYMGEHPRASFGSCPNFCQGTTSTPAKKCATKVPSGPNTS